MDCAAIQTLLILAETQELILIVTIDGKHHMLDKAVKQNGTETKDATKMLGFT